MSKANKKIANEYCKKMLNLLSDEGVWTSDNLGCMLAPERKAILKVYKKYFKTVEYNPVTGVCKCTNGSTTDEKPGGKFLVSGNTGGAFGAPVKAENMPNMAGGEIFIDPMNAFLR